MKLVIICLFICGEVARRYLTLRLQGYHVATSVHADTIDDVLGMYRRDLRLAVDDVRRLGLVINIGLVGKMYPRVEGGLQTFYTAAAAQIGASNVVPVPLSLWNKRK